MHEELVEGPSPALRHRITSSPSLDPSIEHLVLSPPGEVMEGSNEDG